MVAFFLGALSIAGNDETVNVADLSDEFRHPKS